MSESDRLYGFRNNFYLGAYQALVDDHEIEGLTESEVLERDTILHRSSIALGNHQVSLLIFAFDRPMPISSCTSRHK